MKKLIGFKIKFNLKLENYSYVPFYKDWYMFAPSLEIANQILFNCMKEWVFNDFNNKYESKISKEDYTLVETSYYIDTDEVKNDIEFILKWSTGYFGSKYFFCNHKINSNKKSWNKNFRILDPTDISFDLKVYRKLYSKCEHCNMNVEDLVYCKICENFICYECAKIKEFVYFCPDCINKENNNYYD